MDAEPRQEQDRQDVVLDLNFVPKWAREPPGQNPYARFGGEERREGRERRGRGRDRDRRGRGDRREGRFGGERRGERRDDRRGGGRPGERRGEGGRDRFGRGRGEGPRREGEQRWAPPPPVPVQISFIPERRALGAVAHDLRTSGRAYPLANVAGKLLANAGAYMVKLEVRGGKQGDQPVRLYQCKECKVVALDRASLAAHAKANHMDLFFVREDVETEAPAGHFKCVARCRMSGTLLGPPNYHGYNDKVQAVWRQRFPHLSLDEYRQNIETVHDPELIEQWKKEQSCETVYRLRDQENALPMKPAEAEAYMVEHFLPSLVVEGGRFIVPAEAAHRCEDNRLRRAMREAWQRESQRPYSLMLALRPAFSHMHLYLFKTRQGATFVTRYAPHPVEPEHAVKPIAEVIEFLRSHPGCTRQELVDKLRPGMAPDSEAVAAVVAPLRWLIEKGHVIEFFDGTLSVPAGAAAAGRGR